MQKNIKSNDLINVAVFGASGYSGAELLRLLSCHELCKVVAVTGERQAGKSVGEVFPHLSDLELPNLVKISDVQVENIDAVFCCLPHGTTHDVITRLPDSLRCIDLSADFRIFDTDVYEAVYGNPHKAKALQAEAVYGLTELERKKIKVANLVACPGCYPTSVQLPLIPLLRGKVISLDSILVDSKSGVSGAGREAKQENLFSEISGGVRAYNVGMHRHVPEIEQGLSGAAGQDVAINFTPHLIPMSRGILSTIYVKFENNMSIHEARDVLASNYKDELFVRILPEGETPSTKHTVGTNKCIISLHQGRRPDELIIISVIDNLIKGASGQALQNLNVMFGFHESMGLCNYSNYP